jgi:hypothetical protein
MTAAREAVEQFIASEQADVLLQIPRLRRRSHVLDLESRRCSGHALVVVVQEARVDGVTTPEVDRPALVHAVHESGRREVLASAAVPTSVDVLGAALLAVGAGGDEVAGSKVVRAWRARSNRGDAPADLCVLLDRLVERKRDLFKIEDDRIRGLDTQGAATGAAALVGVAAIATAIGRSVDPTTGGGRVGDQAGNDALALVFAIVAAVAALGTLLVSLLERRENPCPLRVRHNWHTDKRATDIPEILADVTRSAGDIAPYIGLADERVERHVHQLRRAHPKLYTARAPQRDEVTVRLQLLDTWDLRFRSAGSRRRAKAQYLTLAAILLVAELLIATIALVLAR